MKAGDLNAVGRGDKNNNNVGCVREKWGVDGGGRCWHAKSPSSYWTFPRGKGPIAKQRSTSVSSSTLSFHIKPRNGIPTDVTHYFFIHISRVDNDEGNGF